MASYLDYAGSFADVARIFCRWCEETAGPKTAKAAATWLSTLHAGALALPSEQPDDDGDAPELPADLLAKVKVGLAPYRGLYYRMVFNPTPLGTEEPVMGDLGDDLEDIYRDIRRGLFLYEGGRTAAAVWHWRFHHEIHWGQHACAALYALHHYAQEHGENAV